MIPPRLMSMYLVCIILLGGCVTLAQPRTASQQHEVAEPLTAASHKATQALVALGSGVIQTSPDQRQLSTKLNTAVTMHVLLTPKDRGTLIEAHAIAAPGYVLVHDVPEDVQAFFAAYQRQ